MTRADFEACGVRCVPLNGGRTVFIPTKWFLEFIKKGYGWMKREAVENLRNNILSEFGIDPKEELKMGVVCKEGGPGEMTFWQANGNLPTTHMEQAREKFDELCEILAINGPQRDQLWRMVLKKIPEKTERL